MCVVHTYKAREEENVQIVGVVEYQQFDQQWLPCVDIFVSRR